MRLKPFVGLTIAAKYPTMTHQGATVIKIEDCLTSRTSLRPLKSLITVRYDNGVEAAMDLGHLRSYWRAV